MSAILKNNVKQSGNGRRPMIFAHGYGCDQQMWRLVAPAFEDRFNVVTFDHVGAGGSDLSSYDRQRYSSIDAYADDIVDIGRELDFNDAIIVGHSVSAMIGALASIKAPEMFSSVVMVGPSPRYINDGSYIGGFEQEDIDELLASLAENHIAWSNAMAPTIMGNSDRPELASELADSFCRMDPEIARTFARVTFTSDNRADLPKVTAQVLVLQCRDDIIASENVGRYVADAIPHAQFVMLDATGHCPNLSAPQAVISAIKGFV
ncbi:alpha/beta hydrolase [Agrobacterium tumefaciens]|uniref:alpha/beta fold hydrolase n=1 Tax=Agrobacterium TaxID=357 RepID=UPI001EC2206F|nr:alpha/beta hydrolase [Agrobacterium sp. CNPSo 3708]MDD1499145.1 alpha/beta hydrolase [Agrobacterium sp. CNPSo 3708]MQB22450.1 alpha/beta hydrolase [Agrobacterium tumefaciens]